MTNAAVTIILASGVFAALYLLANAT